MVRRNAFTNQSINLPLLKKIELDSFLIDSDTIIMFGVEVFVALIFNAGKDIFDLIRTMSIINGKSILNHIGFSALI